MFVGRTRELELLERQHHSGRFEFTTIYGRRRIGKTELIRQHIRGKRALYYMALESNPETNLELLSRLVTEFGDHQRQEPVSSYEDLFSRITALAARERLVFVIDEFPYLAQAYPEISSLIQKFCDHQWKTSQLHLILCGSTLDSPDQNVTGSSPLYGRRTAQIRLKPFDFFETQELLAPMSKEDTAILYCATGGVAEYLDYVDPEKTLEQNLVALYFTDSGRLYEEPINFLKQELREPRIYNTILNAIARGANKLGEIASKARLDNREVAIYLDQLLELGIIQIDSPLGGSPRKSLYRIADGSFRFWFRYVFPNMSAIELGAGRRLYHSYIEKDLANFMGEGFERIFLDYFDRMNARGELPVLVTQRGRWWGNNAAARREEEIDLIGRGGDQLIFAEVKWTRRRIDQAVITDLITKSRLVKGDHRYYLFFSKTGFTKKAMAYAQQRDNIRLVTFLEPPGNLRQNDAGLAT